MTANGCGVSVWATKNVLELVVMMVTLLCTRNPELYTLCVPVWFMIACMFVCALLGAFLGKTAVNTHLVLNSSPRVPGTHPSLPLFSGVTDAHDQGFARDHMSAKQALYALYHFTSQSLNHTF